MSYRILDLPTKAVFGTIANGDPMAMRKYGRPTFPSWLLVVACVLGSAGPLQAQRSSDSALQITTLERLETESWWPTMAAAPLDAYAGSQACGKCHEEVGPLSAMRRAAEPASNSRFLKNSSVTLQVASLRYTVTSSGQGLDYTVSDRDRKISEKLAWTIGAGELGRTFLYQNNGRWEQSEVSFYTKPASLDITTGLGGPASTALATALGQQLTPEDARSCFNCHTVHATTSAGLEPLHAEPGVGCEACHGPARQHVSRMAARERGGDSPAHVTKASIESNAVFDPSRLSPEDSIDFCGACHRTSADAKLSVTQDFRMSVVRFQPYRLQESRCWRATKDQRLTCVACHNPHKPLDRDPASYDKQCTDCHSGQIAQKLGMEHAARVCPTARANCVSCHMPKVAVPTMHGEFTDHYIRVVRPGDAPPR